MRHISELRSSEVAVEFFPSVLVDVPHSKSRGDLQHLAKRSGGRVLSLRRVEEAEVVWREVEEALAHLWVAVFEPSSPEVQPRDAEVRTTEGDLLRPGD